MNALKRMTSQMSSRYNDITPMFKKLGSIKQRKP